MTERTPAIPGATSRRVEIDTADAGRIEIAVEELGDGPPVLMLHGWPEHAGCWAGVAPLLAGRYRAICPDLRGFGLSDAPGTGYDTTTFASDQIALLDALGLERVHLVGHDWGGFAGFLMCLDHPERVSSYLVTNTGLPWTSPSPRNVLGLWRLWYAVAMSLPFLTERMLRRGQRRFAKAFYEEAHGKMSAAAAAGYAAKLAEPAAARATVALYRAYLRLAFTLPLGRPYRHKRLEMPAHFLFGTADRAVPTSFVTDFERHGDDLRLELVPGRGHFLPEEEPELVARRAHDLFARST